jgi:hypothetical protein
MLTARGWFLVSFQLQAFFFSQQKPNAVCQGIKNDSGPNLRIDPSDSMNQIVLFLTLWRKFAGRKPNRYPGVFLKI